jgi:3-methylcrotonyl-CoA carboxylase alpha subunit
MVRPEKMFRRVLIANRGEIANRIIETLQRLKIDSVVIYNERENEAPYIKRATEAVNLGSGDLSNTFLNIDKILKIAVEKECDAIHPGYGFLSENSKFASACINRGIVFIGPKPETIDLMGNKTRAIEEMIRLGIPIVPNIRGPIGDIVNNISGGFFPCIVKASAGGGGKGMQIAHNPVSLLSLLKQTSLESERYFGDAGVYIEKYLKNPRHIEIQILADQFGNAVHLFERECSIQRRFQKIIEESPALSLNKTIKDKIYSDSLKIAKAVNYIGAGTIEFLLDEEGNHYFLEMNTRIQVEHAVTEMVTGVDIVEEQLAIATGQSVIDRLKNTRIKGHAIEARIYAEDPDNNYNPSPGIVQQLSLPEKGYIRIDSDLSQGRKILPDFDPMIAKIIVWGENRNQAIDRILQELYSVQIHGIKTNIKQLLAVFGNQKFRDNAISTHFLADLKILEEISLAEIETELLIAAAAWLSLYKLPGHQKNYHQLNIGRWRIHKYLKILFNNSSYEPALIKHSLQSVKIELNGRFMNLYIEAATDNHILVLNNSNRFRINYSWDNETLGLSLSFDYRIFQFFRPDILSYNQKSYVGSEFKVLGHETINAPLSGKVIKINFQNGQKINKGDTILLIESMKMENEIRIPFDGIIKQFLVKEGNMVIEGELLLELEPDG